MKDIKELQNKGSMPGAFEDKPAEPVLMKVQIRQGRNVDEGGPGAVITVSQTRAQYLVSIGFADFMVEE